MLPPLYPSIADVVHYLNAFEDDENHRPHGLDGDGFHCVREGLAAVFLARRPGVAVGIAACGDILGGLLFELFRDEGGGFLGKIWEPSKEICPSVERFECAGVATAPHCVPSALAGGPSTSTGRLPRTRAGPLC